MSKDRGGGMQENLAKTEAEEIVRDVIVACSDCDICRYLMEDSCLMFPQLYRLTDRKRENGLEISSAELKHLVDLCTFCALCPCPNIRSDLMRAKRGFIERDGLPPRIRLLEDVELFGKLCGTLPRLTNRLLGNHHAGRILKASLGIHQDRFFPEFPDQDFPHWAEKQGITQSCRASGKLRVAYFAGCTGRHLFPQVPEAAVRVLEANGVEVYYPEQKCCGMPTLLEGDVKRALSFVRFNVDRLLEAVMDGYDLVCSCPTCGFFFKGILPEGAHYSEQFQDSVGAAKDQIKVPLDGAKTGADKRRFAVLQKSLYGHILKDQGSFSAISADARITLAEHTYDLGEYLILLDRDGRLKRPRGMNSERLLYYPPCHQREQKIGRPYRDLLERLFGLQLESLDASMYCCGLGGIMGFKKEFHDHSISLGAQLMRRIRELKPDRIVTDCLSCRLQFAQLTPFPVSHPIELLRDGYLR